jgi:hypothetical protein
MRPPPDSTRTISLGADQHPPHDRHPGPTANNPDTNAPTRDALIPANPTPLTTGRYVLHAEIARGGMGVVYRAADTVLGRDVAIKVLQDRFGVTSGAARRFADEARITGQLQHPAVPPVHDLGTLPDGRPFLAMKLIKGDTLDDLLRLRPDPSVERGRFVAAFEQVCQAVACAHAHQVIHRDLKPANVMVGSFGEVQVMDWGLAKVLGTRSATADPDATAWTEIHSLRDSDAEFTQAGSVLGTPAFMPPEQAIGAVDQVDARSDVFGLGAILAVILSGRPPFVAESAEVTRQAAAKGHVAECFARLDACGAAPELVTLCKRCLATEKADRPADAGEVARVVAELRAAADERARQAELDKVRAEAERAAAESRAALERATVEARAAERRRRRRVWIGAAAALAAVTIGGLAAVLAVQSRARRDLEQKNDELADKNRTLADKQAKVEARFELARQAIAKLYTGVSEDLLLRSDQFKELRAKLLKEAAGFYAEMESLLEGESDPKSRRLLADGYFQLADLTARIGSPTEALAVHRQALSIRRELAAVPGVEPGARLDVARSLGAISERLFFTGDAEGAWRVAEEQRVLAASVVADHPTEPGRVVLAEGFHNAGRALVRMGRVEDGQVAIVTGMDLMRALATANSSADLRYQLAQSLIVSEMALHEMAKWKEAAAASESARAILQQLSEEYPEVTQYRYRLAAATNNFAASISDQGMPAEALTAAERARAMTQVLAETHPAVTNYHSLLGTINLNIGRARLELGNPAAARAAYQTALTR